MTSPGSRSTVKRGQAAARGSAAARERRRVVAELRAFAHPLRLRLFELFAERPRTTMQAAELLGEPPTRLYHHVYALERAGLLRLRETRPNRGTIEKYYESVVKGFRGARASVLGHSPAARQSARAAASAVLEQARQDLLASLADVKRAGAFRPLLFRMLFTASPARAASLRRRLLALVKEFRIEGAARAKSPGAGRSGSRARRERWALTVGLAPSWPRRRGDGS